MFAFSPLRVKYHALTTPLCKCKQHHYTVCSQYWDSIKWVFFLGPFGVLILKILAELNVYSPIPMIPGDWHFHTKHHRDSCGSIHHWRISTKCILKLNEWLGRYQHQVSCCGTWLYQLPAFVHYVTNFTHVFPSQAIIHSVLLIRIQVSCEIMKRRLP